jgi:hypothetical protein
MTGAPSVYRYLDATPYVEFGLKRARSVLDLHLQGQLWTLQQYDTVVRAINRRYDLLGPSLRTLIIACMEQRGRLSSAAATHTPTLFLMARSRRSSRREVLA